MGEITCIMRRSIHTFLQKYHQFTLAAALLALPFSAAVLFSEIFLSSSSFYSIIHERMELFFHAAGFPSSWFFSLLNLKLSQTITSSLLTFPFSISSLLLSKSFVIHLLSNTKPLLWPLFVTHLCNNMLLLSLNATAFFILVLSYNLLVFFNLSFNLLIYGLSAIGATIYSIFLTRVLAVCSLALVMSATERQGGFLPLLKTYILIRCKMTTVLSVVLPANMAMAVVEAIFYHRIIKPFKLTFFISVEALLVAYLYSIILVIDAIISYMFCKSLQENCSQLNESKHSSHTRITMPCSETCHVPCHPSADGYHSMQIILHEV